MDLTNLLLTLTMLAGFPLGVLLPLDIVRNIFSIKEELVSAKRYLIFARQMLVGVIAIIAVIGIDTRTLLVAIAVLLLIVNEFRRPLVLLSYACYAIMVLLEPETYAVLIAGLVFLYGLPAGTLAIMLRLIRRQHS